MFNRSFHFVPLSNSRFLSNISEIKSDCIILDLEDGVSLKEKELARYNLKLSFGNNIDNNIYLRINTESIVQFKKDIILINETKWSNIMLPKVSLNLIEVLNKEIKHDFVLFPLFESIGSIYQFEKIVSSIGNLNYIGLGLEDILSEYAPDKDDLEEFIRNINNSIIFKSKAFNIACIDGVNLDFNLSSFEIICEKSKSFGFDGKMSIHPSQVDVINKIWAVEKNQYLHAKVVIDFIGSDIESGYMKYNEEIITPPKIKKYQTIIREYEKKV